MPVEAKQNRKDKPINEVTKIDDIGDDEITYTPEELVVIIEAFKGGVFGYFKGNRQKRENSR